MGSAGSVVAGAEIVEARVGAFVGGAVGVSVGGLGVTVGGASVFGIVGVSVGISVSATVFGMVGRAVGASPDASVFGVVGGAVGIRSVQLSLTLSEETLVCLSFGHLEQMLTNLWSTWSEEV